LKVGRVLRWYLVAQPVITKRVKMRLKAIRVPLILELKLSEMKFLILVWNLMLLLLRQFLNKPLKLKVLRQLRALLSVAAVLRIKARAAGLLITPKIRIKMFPVAE
jgi:hypothetical protein